MLSEALSVARGESPPRHSRSEYLSEAVRWAARQEQAGETPPVTFARLAASRSVGLEVLYRAAAIARALDDLDPSDLIPVDEPDADARRIAWADLLRLVEPHGLPSETLPSTLRRMLRENLAARSIYLLILQ